MSMSNTKKSKYADYILNCIPSKATETEEDWTFEDAISAGLIDDRAAIPKTMDLREDWWPADDQKHTGACVGYAAAYGVLRWLYVKHGLLSIDIKPSARFIWMANKETDDITSFPTTFLERTGTQTKYAFKIAQRYGCVTDQELPMDGSLCSLSRGAFYSRAAHLRIRSYHNIGRNLSDWRRWIAHSGPLLTRLSVDSTWDNATQNNGALNTYDRASQRGGHAVCIVGYDNTGFIVRNSWGENWGDKGFAYASDQYAMDAFSDTYGAQI